jgi:hypothetical protein
MSRRDDGKPTGTAVDRSDGRVSATIVRVIMRFH